MAVMIKDMEMPRWCGECGMCKEETINSNTFTYCELLNQDITWNGNRIENCPLVEIEERKVGKWIIDDKEQGRIWHCHCSNCKKDPQDYIGGTENWWLVRLPDYCPNCGSRNERR